MRLYVYRRVSLWCCDCDAGCVASGGVECASRERASRTCAPREECVCAVVVCVCTCVCASSRGCMSRGCAPREECVTMVGWCCVVDATCVAGCAADCAARGCECVRLEYIAGVTR